MPEGWLGALTYVVPPELAEEAVGDGLAWEPTGRPKTCQNDCLWGPELIAGITKIEWRHKATYGNRSLRHAWVP